MVGGFGSAGRGAGMGLCGKALSSNEVHRLPQRGRSDWAGDAYMRVAQRGQACEDGWI